MTRLQLARFEERVARGLRKTLVTTGLSLGVLGCGGGEADSAAVDEPPATQGSPEGTALGAPGGLDNPFSGGQVAPPASGLPGSAVTGPPVASADPTLATGGGAPPVIPATSDMATKPDSGTSPAQETTPGGDPSGWNDPGPGAFDAVPEDQVGEVCKMDIDLLRANFWGNGAVFRYGKLCYSRGRIDNPYGVFSATKTVAGTVMASAYLQTAGNADRMLPSDAISEWGGSSGTRISEFAGMVTSGRFAYDTFGTNLARTGAPMQNSLRQGSVSGATTLAAVRDDLFEKLGVRGRWPTGGWGTGANVSLEDLGRIGIALGHNGWWNGEQVLDPDWVYWMTHPHWENLNTSYGMYAWLNHRGNATGIGGTLSASGAGPSGGDPCAPAAVWQQYPHPPSMATDCNPAPGNSCEQTYDTGVFSAQGLGGQFMVVHRGLDLVMVARSYSGQGGPTGLWNALRPAVAALDPMFQGDEAAFCEAYGNGDYAPDMVVEPVQPPTQ